MFQHCIGLYTDMIFKSYCIQTGIMRGIMASHHTVAEQMMQLE